MKNTLEKNRPIEADVLADVEASLRIKALWEACAERAGLKMPVGRVLFRMSEGTGDGILFRNPRGSAPQYISTDGKKVLTDGQGGFHKRPMYGTVAINPTFRMQVGGRDMEFFYGTPGDSNYDPVLKKTTQTASTQPIRSVDGVIAVDPSVDPMLFYYLSMCPWCGASPVYYLQEKKQKLGIDLSMSQQHRGCTAFIAPDDQNLTEDRLDEIAAADNAFLSRIGAMSEPELERMCRAGRVELRGNAADFKKEMVRKLQEIVTGRHKEPFKSKYDMIVMAASGTLKDYLSTIRMAIRYKILACDGVQWSLNNTRIGWSIMDNVEEGKEDEWLAEKIAKDNLESWYNMLDSLTNEANNAAIEEAMARPGIDGIIYAARQRAIIIYDGKAKCVRWAIDKEAVVECGSGNPTAIDNKLKELWKDMTPEQLAVLVESKTPSQN